MKNILKFISIAAALILGTVMVSCSGNIDPDETGGADLVLKVFPEGIVADGVTAATFTVKHKGEDISSSAVIYCTTTGSEVKDCMFTTLNAGEYEFVATSGELKSNVVKVVAIAAGEGVRVSVSKEQIEADGKDVVRLTLTDREGKVLNEEQDFVYFTVQETGEEFKRTNEFTAVENGTYTIAVKYKSQPCANTVKVTAVNRAKYEKYYHIVPVYDLTNVQCQYCSVYAKGLEDIPELYKGHALVIGVHGNFNPNDPWLYLTSSIATNLMGVFEGTGYPTIIYNLDKKVPADETEYTGAGIAQRIVEQMKKYPSTSGIKLASTYDVVSGKLEISVSMTSVQAAKYDIGCAVLLDNQDVSAISPYFTEVDDILVNVSGNYYAMSVESFTAVADKEQSRTWTIDLPSEFVENCGGSGNFRVVGFSLIEADGKVRFDNANVCALGESADYRLN